ncbi:UNVERIFIED_CONTAM: hypothetical protein RMT77_018635 [Armadillidium vulgare]
MFISAKMSRKRKYIDFEEAEQLLFSSDSECNSVHGIYSELDYDSSDSEFDEGFSNFGLRDFDEINRANDDEPPPHDHGEPVSLQTQSTARHIDEDENVSMQPQTRQKPPSKKKSKQDSEIFQWIKIGTENGSSRKSEKFTGENKAKFETLGKTMPEIFYEIFPDSIFELMVKSTNAYAKKFLSDKKDNIKKSSRCNAWYDVTIQEMRQFLGLYILMGIIHKPTINSYWATDKYLRTPTFPSVMKRDRFCNILTFLHFEDASETIDFSNEPERRLWKLNSLMHILDEAIGKKYYPSQNLSLDESLLLWKGRLIFRQYIKSKRSRFGIKIFKLVDSNGVTVKTNVYTGKMEEENGFSKTETIVVNMMKDFLEKYHHLYTDNFYTTPKLYRYLKEHKTYATGTVRSNGQGMPKDFRTLKIEKGQRSGYETKDLLALLFNDKRNVYMLSNCHENGVIEVTRRSKAGRIRENIPLCIKDYNKNMGFVDKTDQVLHYYTMARKTIKWYKKLGMHLIQIRILDALGIYNMDRKKKTPYFNFLLNIVKDLTSQIRNEPKAGPSSTPRLEGSHFPERIPVEKKTKNPQKRCKVCYKHGISAKTIYQCKTCTDHPGLCPHKCFEIYHTKLQY